MQLNKSHLLLIVAGMLLVGSGKVAVSAKAVHAHIVVENEKISHSKSELSTIDSLKQYVFKAIPQGNEKLDSISVMASHGGLELYNLAVENHLSVGSISISSDAHGDIKLSDAAKTVNMTNGDVKQVSLLLNVDFLNMASLSDFVAKIPETNGYLSELKIKKNSALLTVRFIGA